MAGSPRCASCTCSIIRRRCRAALPSAPARCAHRRPDRGDAGAGRRAAPGGGAAAGRRRAAGGGAAGAGGAFAGRIRCAGRVPHDAAERHCTLVDVLAYPGKRMRLTAGHAPEAAGSDGAGKLVAASDVGGHRELIRDGDTGTSFAPGDPPALARALGGLLADPSGWSARRERPRAFVRTERNWSSNIGRYQPAYQRLLAGVRTDRSWCLPPRT